MATITCTAMIFTTYDFIVKHHAQHHAIVTCHGTANGTAVPSLRALAPLDQSSSLSCEQRASSRPRRPRRGGAARGRDTARRRSSRATRAASASARRRVGASDCASGRCALLGGPRRCAAQVWHDAGRRATHLQVLPAHGARDVLHTAHRGRCRDPRTESASASRRHCHRRQSPLHGPSVAQGISVKKAPEWIA